jgi:hypothetical protein
VRAYSLVWLNMLCAVAVLTKSLRAVEPKVICLQAVWVHVNASRYLPAEVATISTTYKRAKVEVHTEMSEDTVLPPEDVVAIRLSGQVVVYRQAAVELISLLIEELKESVVDNLLFSWVFNSLDVLLELLQPPSSIPELRIEGRSTEGSKSRFSNIHP